jgi:hypothetical protein
MSRAGKDRIKAKRFKFEGNSYDEKGLEEMILWKQNEKRNEAIKKLNKKRGE